MANLYETKNACLTCPYLSFYPDPSSSDLEPGEDVLALCDKEGRFIGHTSDLSASSLVTPNWCPKRPTNKKSE